MEDEDNLAQTSSGALWKNNLYLLQEQAPKPKMIRCRRIIENKPGRYGEEFHGLIDRTEAEDLLKEAGEGAYLVRESKRSLDAYTLCMIFEGHVLNYKLYYDGAHYVGEKRFDNLHDLVADGLICMYVDKHAADYIRRMTDEVIYEHSPYQIYNKSVEKSKQGVQRAHSFAQQTFKMQYCDYCRNFLWGLVQQGVRCVDCGFAAHKKCSEKALMDCQPEAKYVKRIFAIDLTTLCIAHKIGIPIVVSSCIREVEARGLTVEGIYRVSASHEQMERLKRQYDSQHNVNLCQVEDIHTVCGLLKLYLRLLPQQLVPFSVYKSLLQAYTTTTTTNNNHDRTRALRKALHDLCETNSRTLKAILMHLKRVSEYSQENKMSAENLSTIFSPTLFCTGNTPALPQQQHMLLHFLILNPNLVPDYL
ncbi:unnamed protein product, partial [Mesorhabditis belari]|uniref:N-chimaerin n=1 Tax=Mesorhabditis belari TaxID=2138241 RepID=A0AAF3J1G8_9BILA